MTAVAAYLAVVVAFAAVCCGHHGEEFPIRLRWAWNALSARLPASNASRAPELLPHPPDASQARSAHSAPAWARTDKDAA